MTPTIRAPGIPSGLPTDLPRSARGASQPAEAARHTSVLPQGPQLVGRTGLTAYNACAQSFPQESSELLSHVDVKI